MRALTPRQTLIILTGLNLFNYIDRYVLASVLHSVQKDLSINDAQAGWLGTAFMLGYFVTAPFFGWLGDRTSRKWLIASGIFIWSAATVMTGFSEKLAAMLFIQSFAVMLFWRVIVGVGEASYATVSPAWLSDVYPAEKRNTALTWFYTAIPIGAAIGTLLGGFIASHQGWHYAFFWAGAPGLLLALLLLPFKEPARTTDSAGGEHRLPGLKDIGALLRRPDYNLSVWGYTAYTFALGAMAHWGPSFLQRAHHMDQKAASDFFGPMLAVCGLGGTLIGGLAATAWRKRHRSGYAGVLAVSMLLGAPAAWLAFTAGDRTVSMAALAVSMFCCFLGTGPINTLILECSPATLRASAMAGSIFIIHLFGDLWSPWIVGELSVQWNNEIKRALLILPAALLIAGVLWAILAWKQHLTPGEDHGMAESPAV